MTGNHRGRKATERRRPTIKAHLEGTRGSLLLSEKTRGFHDEDHGHENEFKNKRQIGEEKHAEGLEHRQSSRMRQGAHQASEPSHDDDHENIGENVESHARIGAEMNGPAITPAKPARAAPTEKTPRKTMER